MRRLADIDLLDDAPLQAQLTYASWAILLAGTLVGVLGAAALPHEKVGPTWFLALGVASVVALPIHELVHAAAFALLSGFRARISFGFSSWMLYTSAAGTILPRGRFCAVLLAPSVLVTAALGLAAALAGLPLMAWFLCVIHLAGCTGDLCFVHIIAREPLANLVEDTPQGIALLHDD